HIQTYLGPHPHRRAPREGGVNAGRGAEAVEDRQRREDDILLVEADPGSELERLADEVPVREHDSLWGAGRPAGGEEGDEVVGLYRRRGLSGVVVPPQHHNTTTRAHVR